jgi:hypothetical protein
MNFETDDLLDYVDQWKFKLHEELKTMTPEQRAAFWKQVREKARKAGLKVAEPATASRRRAKRSSQAAG